MIDAIKILNYKIKIRDAKSRTGKQNLHNMKMIQHRIRIKAVQNLKEHYSRNVIILLKKRALLLKFFYESLCVCIV